MSDARSVHPARVGGVLFFLREPKSGEAALAAASEDLTGYGGDGRDDSPDPPTPIEGCLPLIATPTDSQDEDAHIKSALLLRPEKARRASVDLYPEPLVVGDERERIIRPPWIEGLVVAVVAPDAAQGEDRADENERPPRLLHARTLPRRGSRACDFLDIMKGCVYAHAVRALGQVLRRARRDAGMSQDALAKKAKVDRSYVSDLERGTHLPTVPMLIKLCKAIGIAPSELMRRLEKE
jgi:ribosome-binding protein aMBF1 (putative translation factor)